VVVAIDQDPPHRIHISSARDIRSTRAIRTHRPKSLELANHRRLPVTTVARTLLDLAATLPFADVRRALAEADHRRLLRPQEVERALGWGRPVAPRCVARSSDISPLSPKR
jgi:hypothetical protein